MDNNSKIVKFYITKDYDKDGKSCDLYCYVTKDNTTGKETVHFTRDKDEYKRAFVKCATDNGYRYKKDEIINLFVDYPDKFNVNCKSSREIFDRINADGDNVSYDDFVDAKVAYDKEYFNKDDEKEKEGLFKRIKDFKLPKITNIKVTKKAVKKILAGVALVGVTIASFSLGRCSSGGDAIVDEMEDTKDDDIPDKKIDKSTVKRVVDAINDSINKAVDATKNIMDNAQAETTATSSTTYYSSNNSGSSGGSSGSSSSGGGVTGAAGSVNDGYREFQDPNESIGDGNESGNQPSEENPYDNIITGEEPVDEGNTEGEFDEEIDVSDDKEDNVNLDDKFEGNESGNQPSEENPYDNIITGEEPVDEGNTEGEFDEEIDVSDDKEDNVNLDDKFEGNEGAIDEDSITSTPPEGWTNDPLPSPDDLDKIASDGNYVIDGDELKENNNQTDDNITTEQDTTPDFVPVEQEPAETTLIMSSEEPSYETTTIANENRNTNVQAVDQAVEAMANGEEGNLVVGADGSISFETTTNAMEANGMAK